MLENFSGFLEEVIFINISYAKNEFGDLVSEEKLEVVEALVNNGTTRATSTNGNVEFIDYLKVMYVDGFLSKGDKVEIKGEKYRVASNPKSYGTHCKAEVVKIV